MLARELKKFLKESNKFFNDSAAFAKISFCVFVTTSLLELNAVIKACCPRDV